MTTNMCTIKIYLMKNIQKLIIILGFVALTPACNDWLEEENFTKISSDYIYQNEEGLKVGLGALYNLQRNYERVSDATYGNIWFYCADDLGPTTPGPALSPMLG